LKLFLPENFSAVQVGVWDSVEQVTVFGNGFDAKFIVFGVDVDRYTLDQYVLPRLLVRMITVWELVRSEDSLPVEDDPLEVCSG